MVDGNKDYSKLFLSADIIGLKKYTWLFCIFWSLVTLVLMAWDLYQDRDWVEKVALIEARAYFSKDQAFRYWATMHGGVYVPVSEKTRPNKYLSHVPYRDIRRPDGKVLTLYSPAVMVRQMNDEFDRLYGISGRITSLAPLRPENNADQWEAAAIRSFKRGAKEVWDFADIDGKPHIRLMRPMITVKGCLKCHGHQGYSAGSVHGGVNVSVPLKKYVAIKRDHDLVIYLSHGIVLVLGLFGIVLGSHKMQGNISRTREAEIALIESERNFRETLENIKLISIILDTGGRISFCNDFLLELTGRQRDEVIGKSWFDLFIPPEIREEIKINVHEKTVGTREYPQYFENEIMTSDGSRRLVAWNNSILRDHRGNIVGTTSIGEDITEKKISERLLKESERRLKEAQSIASMGHWELDVMKNELNWSDEIYNIFGIDKEAFVNTYETFIDCVHPDDREYVNKAYGDSVAEKSKYDITHRIIRKSDGEVRHVREKCEHYFNDDGTVIRSIGAVMDITEVMRGREMLHEANIMYQTVADYAYDWEYWIYYDDTMKYVSPSCERITGYSRDEIADRPSLLEDMILPEDRDRWHSHRKMDTRGLHEEQFRIKRKDGEIRWIEHACRPVETGDGVFLGFRASNRDITDRKKAEEGLRLSEEKYRALVENSPDIIMRFDRYGRFLFVNSAVEQFYLKDAEQIINKTHRELGFPDEHCLLFEDNIRNVFNESMPIEEEFTFNDLKGPVIMDLRFVPEINDRREVQSVLAIIRDITEFRKAERNYQMLFERMMDGFAIHEIILDEGGNPVDYRFLDVNPSFEQMTGLKRKEIAGRTVQEVLPGIEKSWIERYGDVALTGKTLKFEEYTRGIDKYFEVFAFSPGESQFATVFQDITDRKKAEMEIARRNEELLNLTAHLESVREEEKTRISRDIHDYLGQSLTALRLDLSWIAGKLADDQQSLYKKIKGMLAVIDITLNDVRNICAELRPGILDHLGLTAAIDWQSREIAKRTGLKFECRFDPPEITIDKQIAVAFFRIFQEIVTNVFRHANAKNVAVDVIMLNDELTMTVRDDGKGIAEEEIAGPRSFGIIGMRERIRNLGGELEIHGDEGAGTEVILSISI